jgi:hypothetical protein
MGVEQGRALALGEAVLARLAVEQADVVPLAIAGADGEIAGVAAGVEGALGVLAAEAREVVHGEGWHGMPGRDETSGWKRKTALILRQILHHGSTDLGHHRLNSRTTSSHL